MKLFDTKINRYNDWNLSQRLPFLSKLEFGLSLSLSLSRKGLKKKKIKLYQNILFSNSRDCSSNI
jgi:hypothetical protein